MPQEEARSSRQPCLPACSVIGGNQSQSRKSDQSQLEFVWENYSTHLNNDQVENSLILRQKIVKIHLIFRFCSQ